MFACRVGLAIIVLWIVGSLAGCGPQEPPRGRPSAIILISLDTLRADMLGVYEYDEYPTSPFLDSLAAQSVVFENSIVQSPWTLTSHMSLFTALHNAEHRVGLQHPLAAGIPTLAERLAEAGYRTQAFVDGAYMQSRWGFDRGFDGYDDGNGEGFASVLPKTRQWLNAVGDSEFFLFLQTYDVHSKGWTPYYPRPAPFSGMFSDRFETDLDSSSFADFDRTFASAGGSLSEVDKRYIKATYAEGIRHVDAMLRSFFEFLSGFDWYEDALIVIWSDHGEGLYDHGIPFHEGEVFDHTIRVPLLFRLPGGVHGGRRIRSVVSSLDVAPTILALADASPLQSPGGESLLPLLEAEDENRVAYSVRSKGVQWEFSIRTQRYHYLWHSGEAGHRMFDLDVDPEEKRNLVGRGLPQEAELRERLAGWAAAHYRNRKTSPASVVLPVDAETEAGLRALGYLQ
jgi:arylsulfatase A-like enzyme